MQRVAQDWLVLQLSDNNGTALGHHDRSPVPADPPALAVRRGGRGPAPEAAAAAAVPGDDGSPGGPPGPPRRHRASPRQWHVYVIALLFGMATAFEAPVRQAFVGELVAPEDLSNAVGLNSASFNAGRIIGPAVAGLTIAALGSGVAGDRRGDPAQRAELRRGALRAARGCRTRTSRSPRRPGAARHGQGRAALRPRPSRPRARGRRDGLRRHLRPQLPADVGAHGDPRLRQGRRGVRHPRVDDGARLDRRRAARRPPRAAEAAPRGPGGAGLRGRGDRHRTDADVPRPSCR